MAKVTAAGHRDTDAAPGGAGPRVPGAAGSPRTASCSDVTDGTGTRAPTLVGGGKTPENATWHSACEGGGFRRARGAEGRGLMAGGGRSTSEQDLLELSQLQPARM